MSDKHYVGLDVTDFEDTGKLQPISRVTLFLDDENYYTAGDDTGKEITASCPSATQAMADALLAKLSGYQHQTFTADAANIDPAAELGDAVTVGGVYAPLGQIRDDGMGYSDIGAADEPEVEDEYPYISPIQQEINRKSTEIYSTISKTSEEIRLEINGLENKQASLSLSLDGLTTRVQDAEGNISTLQQTSTSLKSEISGKINSTQAQSLIDQSIDKISLSVSSANGSTTLTLKDDSTTLSTQTLNLTVNAVNITGTLSASQINMTGAITWSDLSSGVQDEIESGMTEKQVKTLITDELVSSPNIAGAYYWDINQQMYLEINPNTSGKNYILGGSLDLFVNANDYDDPEFERMYSIFYNGDSYISFSVFDYCFMRIVDFTTIKPQQTWDFSNATVTGLDLDDVTAVFG